jgi:hypothetical protein
MYLPRLLTYEKNVRIISVHIQISVKVSDKSVLLNLHIYLTLLIALLTEQTLCFFQRNATAEYIKYMHSLCSYNLSYFKRLFIYIVLMVH